MHEGVPSSSPADAGADIEKARALVDAGRDSDAIALLSRVLLADPRSAEAHLLAAAAYEHMGLYTDAADHVTLVLAADRARGAQPEQLDVERHLARILERLGDRRGLIRCLRRIVAAGDRNDLDALTMLGIALSSSGHHDEAIEILREVAERRGDSGASYADLGMAALTADKLDVAAEALAQALKLDPGSPQAHCGMGLCHQKMGRLKEAEQSFTATERLAPQLAVGPFNLGLVLEAAGDKPAARRALLRAVALEPTDPEIGVALDRLFAEPVDNLFDVLELVRLRGKTGTLSARSKRGAGAVHVVQGQVTSAAVPATVAFDRALLDAGVITRDALKALVARAGVDPKSPEALGTLLVREQAVERRQLSKLLSRRIHDALVEMSAWTDGAFSFHAEAEREPPAIFFNLRDVMSQLLRAGDRRGQGARGPAL